MRARFKIPLMFVGVLLILSLIISFSYKTYKAIKTEASIEIDLPLSINYLNSTKLNNRNHKNIKFSVTNNGEKAEYYYIGFDNLNTASELEYSLTSDKIINKIDKLTADTLVNFINIEPGETHNYVLTIKGNTKNFSAILKVRKEENISDTFASIILKYNEVKDAPITSVGKEIATLDEGLIKDIDDSGNTYYFRGSVINNYVSFANKMWRIVRINGDGTVKLLLEDTLLGSFYGDIEEIDFSESKMYKTLESWYSENLSKYDEYISSYKFCNDNSKQDVNSVLASYKRIIDDKIASFKCLGNKTTSKIGLLTIDEVVYAGAVYNKKNSNFYLNDFKVDDGFYTMSGAEIKNNHYYPFYIKGDGNITLNVEGSLIREIRPAINIIKILEVTGDGKKDNPYIFELTQK